MSHFTVLVIGPDYDKQLAPFHEYECTGHDDEFVIDVDETEKYRKEWETNTRTMARTPDGKYTSPYENQFYRDPTPEEQEKMGPGRIHGLGGGHGLSWDSRDWGDGKGYRTKIHYIPEGYEEVEMLHKDIMSFRDFLGDYHDFSIVLDGHVLSKDEKYRYALVDKDGNVLKVIRRTNPNSKWDWYVMGGRWSGFFKPKAGRRGTLGKPGSFDNVPEKGYVDQAIKGDIDFDGMRDDAAERAGKQYDKVHAVIAGRTVLPWSHFYDAMPEESNRTREDWDAAREGYRNQEVVLDLNSSKDDDVRWATFDGLESYLVPREQYIQTARNGAGATFAVIHNGQWYQRGEMGWWGSVSDEKDMNTWYREFSALMDTVPDDALLTMVDCHI